MPEKIEYRIVWQRKGKVQRIQPYAIKARAEKRRTQLTQDPSIRYVRMEQRIVGEWAATA